LQQTITTKGKLTKFYTNSI